MLFYNSWYKGIENRTDIRMTAKVVVVIQAGESWMKEIRFVSMWGIIFQATGGTTTNVLGWKWACGNDKTPKGSVCLACSMWVYCDGKSCQATQKGQTIKNAQGHKAQTIQNTQTRVKSLDYVHGRCFEHQDGIKQHVASSGLHRTYETDRSKG